LVISAVEHPSVTGAADHLARHGRRVAQLPVDERGVIRVDLLPRMLDETTRLVSVMLGNNETGVLQPVAAVVELCRRHSIPVHSDAVQAVGKMPVSFADLGVDALSFSAHKFHGPVGIGGLFVRHEAPLTAILFGGFQQAGLRPGTESLALVIGMKTALELWWRGGERRAQQIAGLRDRLAERLRAGFPGLIINGEGAPRLPHTLNVAFPGLDRQAIVMALDMVNIACSTGSACASGSSERSPVLLAMGLPPDVVDGSIRLSLSTFTTESDIDQASSRILQIINNLQRAVSSSGRLAPARVTEQKPI
jgi:cysteine desulfurase